MKQTRQRKLLLFAFDRSATEGEIANATIFSFYHGVSQFPDGQQLRAELTKAPEAKLKVCGTTFLTFGK